MFSRADQSILAQWWWTVDRKLRFMFLALFAIGIMLVATAGSPVAVRIGLDSNHFLWRHLILLVPALCLFFGLSLCKPRMIWRFCALLFLLCLILLVYVLLYGQEIKGAQRWIHLPLFSLQPSELAKPAFIVVAAWFIAMKRNSQSFPSVKVVTALYGIFAVLLLSQPDIGMTVVVTGCMISLIFIAGLKLRVMALLGGFGIAAMAIAYASFSHVRKRINGFLDPDSVDSYQMDKSLDAFRAGGVFGTGPGQGDVKMRLPDAHADFIFSVAGEELGLVLTLVIVLLYAGILYRGFTLLSQKEDFFAILATGGLLTLFGLQAFIHMGSALRLLPAKGMTLPLLSYGGSSLLSMAITTGIILALTRRRSDTDIGSAASFR